MVTFSKRMLPTQAAVYRIVLGACKNVAHVHPDCGLSPRTAKSIAKRAAGTLTANWREVLAAKAVRTAGGQFPTPGHREVCTPLSADRGHEDANGHSEGGAPNVQAVRHHALARKIGEMAGQARRDGNTERLAALTDVLKMISQKSG